MNETPKPAAVIFDIGNVLIEWHPEARFDAMIGRGRREALFAAVDLHTMNERIDLGGDVRDVVYETAARYPAFDAEIRMWHDRWSDLARPAMDRSVRLLRALRKAGIPVFALSNYGRETFERSKADHDFLAEFDRTFLSSHLGVMKPEPRIYEIVEQACGLPPDRLLFTDDRPENIAAARARGWQTHLFESPEGWAARLVQAGLLTEDATA